MLGSIRLSWFIIYIAIAKHFKRINDLLYAHVLGLFTSGQSPHSHLDSSLQAKHVYVNACHDCVNAILGWSHNHLPR